MALPNIIQQINSKLPLSGGTITGDITLNGGLNIKNSVDTSLTRIQGGSAEGKGGRLVLSGMSRSSNSGCCELVATDSVNTATAMFKPDGTFTWGGKNIVRSVNNISANSSGNVTLPPFKLFSETGCKTLAELPEGFYYIRGDSELNPSDKPITNWGMLICCRNGGTPFQIYEVDNSVQRYKRWYSKEVWSDWSLA